MLQPVGTECVSRVGSLTRNDGRCRHENCLNEALGIRFILVMRHSNCGAVAATIVGKSVPGQICSLFYHIQPGVGQGGKNLVAATKANAMIQAKLLSEASTVISEAVNNKLVQLVAGFYDVGTGLVSILRPPIWPV